MPEKQETKRMRKKKKRIRRELCESIKKGAVLYLDGEISSPSKITEAVVKEEHTYMADFVTDDYGYIREIRYDNVRL